MRFVVTPPLTLTLSPEGRGNRIVQGFCCNEGR